jgi:hypothetical protein
MKLQVFKNMRGLIHGADPKRIECDKAGVLKIGTTEIIIVPGKPSIMPNLFHGADGNYDGTFTASDGSVYHLEKVAIRGGWITPPPPLVAEIMELRCRLDEAEDERDSLREKITELENIFDTDSLNFLIK